ncbi:cell division protein ZapA [Candidatus Dependentiae bacterium]|nr:cell division protein ZapA [Candidatus Dependentiae bacterium]
MSDGVKKYTIDILGSPCTIVSDESEEVFTAALSLVTDKLSVASHAGVGDVKKAALVCLLDLATQLVKMQDELQQNRVLQQRLIHHINDHLQGA